MKTLVNCACVFLDELLTPLDGLQCLLIVTIDFSNLVQIIDRLSILFNPFVGQTAPHISLDQNGLIVTKLEFVIDYFAAIVDHRLVMLLFLVAECQVTKDSGLCLGQLFLEKTVKVLPGVLKKLKSLLV